MALDVFTGINGQIKLTETGVIITRKGILGFMTQGLKGEKRIPFSSISSVQFKDAGLVTSGYIQFAVLGGVEARGGLFDATKDENSVMFKRGPQAVGFQQLRDIVEKRVASARNPVVNQAPASLADELQKLAALKEQGILTEEEFADQKVSLLARGRP